MMRRHIYCYCYLLVLFTTYFCRATASCPELINKQCICEEKTVGYYITCTGLETKLDEVIRSLGKRRIQRLSVFNASIPVLRKLPIASIRSIQLSSCSIAEINQLAFENIADDLEEITITHNPLKSLTNFGHLPKIFSLNLNYNQLSVLPESFLDDMNTLRHLRLEGNKICSLSSNAINPVKNKLELLDLSGNCLSSIPAQNLRNCVQLMYLDLSDNMIDLVANFELMNLPLLKELRLSNNTITDIAPMAFMNVPLLEHLYLRNNRLTSIETNRIFQVFKRLEVLDLSNNKLSTIPSIKELPNLKQIHIDQNCITNIDTLAFSSNSQLQLISLQNNRITKISRNSFDSLDQLVVLILANNSIKTLGKGTLDGMRNLQQLNLMNNSLNIIENSTFIAVSKLTTLDLSHNGIHRIEKNAFKHLHNLFWLDLSSNLIATLEKDTFEEKIANILLNENPLRCDDKLDWLITYLVTNQVRTFLPFQSDVLCAAPEKYAGVRLKELMIVKANETLDAVRNTLNSGGGGENGGMGRDLINSILPAGMYGLLPQLTPPPAQVPFGVIPVIGALTESMPAIKNIPGINYVPKVDGEYSQDVHKLNSAIEQFSAPILRVATGGQPVPSDIEQLIKAIPNLVVNVPGVGNMDISKLPPGLIAHVLRGGQIPGVSKETLDRIVKEYLKRMYASAEAIKKGSNKQSETRYLPPIENLPQELVTDVIRGANLPHLSRQETDTIRDYYTAKIPEMIAKNTFSKNGSNSKQLNLSPSVVEIMKMLPPGYDMSKIPSVVIDSLLRGEIPDFSLLPDELQRHLLTDGYRLITTLSNEANKTVEEILRSLPRFERPVVPTFVPYDINDVSNDLNRSEQHAEKLVRVQYYTAVLLGLVGTISITVIVLICVYMKRKRAVAECLDIDKDSLVNPTSAFQSRMNFCTKDLTGEQLVYLGDPTIAPKPHNSLSNMTRQ